MTRAVAIRLAILVALVAWPTFFGRLSETDAERETIWLMLHQLYYLPFSWVGPPLFQSNAEVGLSVQPTGRAFAVFVYVLAFYVVVRIVDRRTIAHERRIERDR
jgi:hypothetical protein